MLKQQTENILKTNQNKEECEKIILKITKIEEKCNKLRKTVEKRINLATDYLDFIKKLEQFRNLSIDLQELFKSLSIYVSSPNEHVFEQHVNGKMKLFENLFKELTDRGQSCIDLLKNVKY